MPKKTTTNEPNRTELLEQKTILEHVGELRKRILQTALAFGAVFVASLAFIRWLIPIIFNSDSMVLLGPLDVLKIYFSVAAILAIGFTLPFAAFQLWKYVTPALTAHERKETLLIIPWIFISFAVGIAFGYYVIFPILYQFLMTLAEGQFEMMITASEYLRFMLISTLPLGFLFELPVVIVFLTSLGLVTPDMLRKKRKYVYLVLVILSVMITPPDFISDFIVITSLLALYEAGIWLSGVTFRKRQKAMAAASAG
ncbi:twin-arginine translocase subunit TatC [Paenibacillaceae bacterium WGS1546]|uniref:twin-arginine translocase subunit TatC n=1 Tax=Cohnella sp. WGS1546 TaxID=3366810 RepID=UPI00372D3CDF